MRTAFKQFHLAGWLCCIVLPTFAQTPSTVEKTAEGFRLMFNQRAGNCVACHSVPDELGRKQGIQSTFAPPLDGVANRYDAATLKQWVRDARVLNPQTLMPPFGVNLGNGVLLTEAQIEAVLAALSSLR